MPGLRADGILGQRPRSEQGWQGWLWWALTVVARIGNPDPGGMKVNAPLGEETFDDATTTETA